MSRQRRGRTEGSIYQRADGYWAASVSDGYYPTGRRRRRTIYGKNKQEVRARLRTAQDEVGRGIIGDAAKTTVGTFLGRWLDTVKSKVQPNTWVSYDRHVRVHVKPRLGHILLTKLEPAHVEQLYADLERDGVSAAMRRKIGTTLGTALRQAIRTKLLRYNPAVDIAKPRASKPEFHVFSPEQVDVFLTAAQDDRLYAMFVLALDSGMRQGELLALHWPDVDFIGGHVQVVKSLEEISGHLRLKETKTKKARRRVDLTQTTLDALNRHRQRMLTEGHDVKTGPVFCDAKGGLLRKHAVVDRAFLPIVSQAGLPEIRFHDLRHTCATMLLLADVNVKVVSERLGHSTIQITLDTYQHVLPTMQRKAVEQLDRLLGRKLAN